MDNIKSLLKNEFRDDGIGTFMMGQQNMGDLFGGEMLSYENNAKKHSMLRRLVGTAMTPNAIATRSFKSMQLSSVSKKNGQPANIMST